MTELGLLLAIHSSGLLFALVLARSLGSRSTVGVGAELHRLGGALLRAADSFVAQELRLVALSAGVIAPVVFAVYSVVLSSGTSPSGPEMGFWAAVGLAVGAACAGLIARHGARLTVRGSVQALAASQTSLDRALGVAIRSGGAVGLLVETASTLGLVLVFGLLFAIKGGLRGGAESWTLGSRIALLMPSYALGVALATVVLGRGGAVYHAAGDMAADLAGERDAGLEHDDARNPAVIADLVGDHVGRSVARAMDAFLSSTIANVTTVIVALSLHEASPSGLPLALLALPLVARAFGVIASAFGVCVARTDDLGNPTAALWRGQAATVVISLAGAAGSTLWLIGDAGWLRFFWAAALGIVAATAAAHAARYRTDRRFGPLRELLETQKVAEAPGLGSAIGVGLEAAVLPILVTGLSMTGAWQLGSSTGVAGGGLLAALLMLMTMSASSPYSLALATFGSIADGARGTSTVAATATDTRRRALRLDEAGFAAATVSQTELILTGSLSVLVAAGVLPLVARGSELGSIDLREPAVLYSGALGAAAVLACAGSAARAGTRGARGVVLEVERQLRAFPRDKAGRNVPADYTPSYKSCVEIATRAALRRLMVPVALGLGVPLVLGLGLRVLFGPGALVLAALAAFILVGSATAMAQSLALEGARVSLSAARRLSRRASEDGAFSAALCGDAVGDLLGHSAGPAAQLALKAAAVVALVVAPFLGGGP